MLDVPFLAPLLIFCAMALFICVCFTRGDGIVRRACFPQRSTELQNGQPKSELTEQETAFAALYCNQLAMIGAQAAITQVLPSDDYGLILV